MKKSGFLNKALRPRSLRSLGLLGQRLKNVSNEHSQNSACFLLCFITFFSEMSGPGLLESVRKILVIQSGLKGPSIPKYEDNLLVVILGFLYLLIAHSFSKWVLHH